MVIRPPQQSRAYVGGRDLAPAGVGSSTRGDATAGRERAPVPAFRSHVGETTELDSLIEQLRHHYRELARIEGYDVPAHEGRTVRLRVQTKHETLLVKEKPYYLTCDEHCAQLRVQAALVASGAPVERLISTNRGDVVASLNGRYFHVSRWIHGDHPRPSKQGNGREMGRALGELHRHGSRYRLDEVPGLARPATRRRAHPRATLDWAALTDRFAPPDHPPQFTQTPVYRRLCARVVRRAAALPWDQLPHVIVHGDAHQHNAIRDSNVGQLLWIDLDDLRWDARLVDLGWMCAVGAAYDWAGPAEDMALREEVDMNFVAEVLTAYGTATSITAIERAQFAAIFELSLVATFDNCLERTDLWASHSRFLADLQKLESLLVHASALDIDGLFTPTGLPDKDAI